MAEADGRERSVFRFPRVPFDLSGLLVGMAGYVAYSESWKVLAKLLSVAPMEKDGAVAVQAGDVLRTQFFGPILAALRLPFQEQVGRLLGYGGPFNVPAMQDGKPVGIAQAWVLDAPALEWLQVAIVAAWMLVLWSVVGGALARVHAVRIARDESPPVDEAFAFSLANLRSFLLAPVFVAGAAVFFIALNLAAGAAGAVPYAGPVLHLVLQPLALLGSIVVAIIAVGGIFGFPVLQAAVATEKNGALDAVSRTFSYVFTRPITFMAGCAVVLFVGTVIGALGHWLLEFVFARTLVRGAEFADVETATAIAAGFRQTTTLNWPSIPTAAGEPIPGAGILWVTWFWGTAGFLAVKGTVLSYVVGGLTDVYFRLRGEVDGMPDSEVFVEGEDASLGEPLPGQPAEAAEDAAGGA